MPPSLQRAVRVNTCNLRVNQQLITEMERWVKDYRERVCLGEKKREEEIVV